MKQINKKSLRIGICILAALLLIAGIVALLRTPKKADTSKGVALLKEMETKDISQIEAKIDSIHGNASSDASSGADDNAEDSDTDASDASDAEITSRNYKQIFADSVVMGDSITESISEYDFLTPSSVIATIGVNMNTMDAHYDILRNLSPKNIFLSYGSNDIERVGDDLEEFKEEYKTIIQTVRSIQPDAKIYMNSIFPVQEKKIESDAHYADVERYNAVLQELCTEEGLTYLDNASLVKPEYFEPDDYHFTADFYPYWLNKMAEAAGLL